MTIEATNGVNFGQKENKTQKKSALPTMVAGGGAAAAGTYYFWKDTITGSKILGLDNDTFTKTFKEIPKEKQGVVDTMSDLRTASTKEKLDAETTDHLNEVFKTDEKLTVDKYLERLDSSDSFKTKAEFDTALKDSKAETERLTKALEDAKDVLKKATTPEAKKVAETALEEAKVHLKLNSITADYLAHQEKVLGKAVNGEITKEVLKAEYPNYLKANAKSGLSSCVEALGKEAPKVSSLKKAGIVGACAAVGIGLLAWAFGGSKKSEA